MRLLACTFLLLLAGCSQTPVTPVTGVKTFALESASGPSITATRMDVDGHHFVVFTETYSSHGLAVVEIHDNAEK